MLKRIWRKITTWLSYGLDSYKEDHKHYSDCHDYIDHECNCGVSREPDPEPNINYTVEVTDKIYVPRGWRLCPTIHKVQYMIDFEKISSYEFYCIRTADSKQVALCLYVNGQLIKLYSADVNTETKRFTSLNRVTPVIFLMDIEISIVFTEALGFNQK